MMDDRSPHRAAATCPDVVVVDDEPDAAREMAQYLSRAGLACTPLSNPWHALRLLGSGQSPRVVVADIRMPELSGLQLVERLNAVNRTDRPEIILVSGNAGFDDAVSAIQLGVRRLLCKPLDLPELVREVKIAAIEGEERTARKRPTCLSPSSGRESSNIEVLVAQSRCRERVFPRQMLSDHCWRMFLELYRLRPRERPVSLTSLALVSGLPMATAVRKIHLMRDLSLVEYTADPKDKRRTFVVLSDAGFERMEKFLAELELELSENKSRSRARLVALPSK